MVGLCWGDTNQEASSGGLVDLCFWYLERLPESCVSSELRGEAIICILTQESQKVKVGMGGQGLKKSLFISLSQPCAWLVLRKPQFSKASVIV